MTSPSKQSPPEAASTAQQSLNIFSDTIVLKKNSNGGARSVADELPEADEDENITVRETDSEVGKPNVEYPLERDHCTVTKYVWRKSYRHSSYSARYEYKTFDIQIDREAEPSEAKRLENVAQRVAQLPALREAVDEIDSYDELVAQQDLVREYEATYRVVKGIWDHDSVKSYALEYTPRMFRIKQFPQGFYTVPVPHHSNVKKILDEKLKDLGIGKYSVAWGGFIVKPEDFSAIYDVVKPAYHIPELDDTLDRNTLNCTTNSL